MRGKGEKMNMSTTKRYQDILQELSKTPREDVVKFRNKYEEALNEFLELKEVYTIASKKSSLEEIKNNTAKPLCALNHKKLPTIWFFSEREFAQDFVNHFRLIKDEVKYIAQLAKLHFDEDEAEKFAKEFENILEQFKTLDMGYLMVFINFL